MNTTETPMRAGDRLMRITEVMDKTAFRRTSIYRMMDREEHPFPRPIKLGETCVRWLESEVNAWIEEMASSRV